MKSPAFRHLTIGSLLTLLPSCAMVSPPDPATDTPVPPRWTAQTATGDSSARNTRPEAWLRDIDDSRLRLLIDEGLRYNHNLRAAAARVRMARASALQSAAQLYPMLTGNLEATRSRRPTGIDNNIMRSTIYNGGLALSWEIDLWSRLGHRKRAANREFAAARADFEAAGLSLAANIAKAWLSALEAEMQVQLAQMTVDAFDEDAFQSRSRFDKGIGGDRATLEVYLTQANADNARSALKARLRNRDTAARALERLLGRYPANAIDVSGEFPKARHSVPAGLPASLLIRRPDLRAAEQRFLAAWHRQEDARRNFLPSLRLTGSAGTTSNSLAKLLDANDAVASIATGLTQPLLEGGRLRAERLRGRAERDLALHQYASTVLVAFEEVEVALASESLLTAEVAALESAAANAVEAETLARRNWRAGTGDILTVLESQRRSFQTRQNLLQIRNLQLRNRIDLHLALGGSY